MYIPRGLVPGSLWIPKSTDNQIPYIKCHRDFPGGTVVKNLPANAGDTGVIPGRGRSHMLRSN